MRRLFLALLVFSALFGTTTAAERFIILASTTSTEQSGFFAHVLPEFERKTGIDVRVTAVGSGQALKIGERGDADVLLVHDRAGEEKFVADGHGRDRRTVMFNDFVIVGPKNDPAGVRGLTNAGLTLTRIAVAGAVFVSRGDDSGTHRMELRLWKAANIDSDKLGGWYRELGQGMGPTLNTAAELNAYTLSDRATWANFGNRGELELLAEGDPALYNPYSSILVKPIAAQRAADAIIWHEWITGEAGRKAIESFRIGGEQLFFLPGSKPGS